MKERPILFSGPMVRAILDGRKTLDIGVCFATVLTCLSKTLLNAKNTLLKGILSDEMSLSDLHLNAITETGNPLGSEGLNWLTNTVRKTTREQDLNTPSFAWRLLRRMVENVLVVVSLKSFFLSWITQETMERFTGNESEGDQSLFTHGLKLMDFLNRDCNCFVQIAIRERIEMEAYAHTN